MNSGLMCIYFVTRVHRSLWLTLYSKVEFSVHLHERIKCLCDCLKWKWWLSACALALLSFLCYRKQSLLLTTCGEADSQADLYCFVNVHFSRPAIVPVLALTHILVSELTKCYSLLVLLVFMCAQTHTRTHICVLVVLLRIACFSPAPAYTSFFVHTPNQLLLSCANCELKYSNFPEHRLVVVTTLLKLAMHCMFKYLLLV